jgi:hypothetical protein
MKEPKLHQSIETLYAEIQKVKSIDAQDKELLSRLENEIREFLEKSKQGAGEMQPNAFRRLQSELSRFESSHPALTVLVSQILDDLSSIGL